MSPSTDHRCTLANVLPPIFICTIVGTIWGIYLKLHLMPLLQFAGSTATAVESALHYKGVWQTVVSQVLAAMFTICFTRSLLAKPGSVSSDPEWMLGSQGSADVTTRELKATGDRRFCKWCQTYKPDRCHHCRICKRCVLKMDHHCPWIMNCVGFSNHKYFFLLVVYAVMNCVFITWTISESVHRSVVEETSATDRFLLVLGLVLSTIMGVLMGSFLCFHTWLLFKGMTTIEFCEKTLSGGPNSGAGSRSASYNLGMYKNLKAVLGPYWWLWLVPVCPPEGTGKTFVAAPVVSDKTDLYAACSVTNSAQGSPREPEWTGNEDSMPLTA